ADKATGRSFVATPASGQSARSLQARLLDQPDIVDAVPDAGRVRFVRGAIAESSGAQPSSVEPVAPRFEDGFMILLQAHSEREHSKPMAIAHPLARQDQEPAVRVREL